MLSIIIRSEYDNDAYIIVIYRSLQKQKGCFDSAGLPQLQLQSKRRAYKQIY